jgi:hypothetical protein
MRLFFPPTNKSPRRFWGATLWRQFQTVAALSLLTGLFVATQASGQTPKVTSQDLTLEAKDGAEIKITYFKSPAGQESPVVIMLHGKGGNRLVWKSMAEFLQQKLEFAVITVDLRGHGESSGGAGTTGKKADSNVKARDYAAMIEFDMEAVKKFTFEENQAKNLNMNKIAIVAADMSTPVAVAYTEYDWAKTPYDDAVTPELQTPRGRDVQALVLLSPEYNAPGLPISKSLGTIRLLERPVLICVGDKNPADLKEAKKVHEALAPRTVKSPQIVYKQYPVKLTGTNLLGADQKTEEDLVNFLFEHVKKLKGQWRDRKSKLD